jgi:hypothetical protein
VYRYLLYVKRYRRPLIVVGAIVTVLVAIILVVLWIGYRSQPKVTDFNSCIAAGYDASNSDPQTCTDGHHTYVAVEAANPVTSGGSVEVAQAYSILVSNDSRGDYPARQQVITNQADWASVWDQLYAQVKPTPPLLSVDFSANEVILLTQGPEPSNGYGLEVIGLTVSAMGTAVDYDSFSPLGSCSSVTGPTDPVVAIVTAKTPVPITYQSTPKSRKC